MLKACIYSFLEHGLTYLNKLTSKFSTNHLHLYPLVYHKMEMALLWVVRRTLPCIRTSISWVSLTFHEFSNFSLTNFCMFLFV